MPAGTENKKKTTIMKKEVAEELNRQIHNVLVLCKDLDKVIELLKENNINHVKIH